MTPASQKGSMLAGEQYIAADPELANDNRRAASLREMYNAITASDSEGRRAILQRLLGHFGEGAEIRGPFSCEYGRYIPVGARRLINSGAMLPDCAPIAIGDNTVAGAGAVVTKDLPADVVPVGNPEKLIREL